MAESAVMAKKSDKKNLSAKNTKKRLFCVTLPTSLLETTRAYRKKSGFTSMSELLRATVEHADRVAQKKNLPEKKKQISFRLSDSLYTSLLRTANQTEQSVARIIRTLLENAPKLGIRPAGLPEKKKKAVAAPAPAKKAKAPVAKKTAAKKPAPKKAVPAKKAPKKSVPAKKSVKRR